MEQEKKVLQTVLWEKRVGRGIFSVTFTSKTRPPFNPATSGDLKKVHPQTVQNLQEFFWLLAFLVRMLMQGTGFVGRLCSKHDLSRPQSSETL